ncbi:MAG: hypothetical protein NZ651_01845 [Candidatus Bipolaricaulota bacterium]|nr:hypothetical protein [Candidatus Bipolaricaulota bacterium]MDW8126502.1 hypothetical protein [Candidatus Bipolaricaulota bacterium]
MKKMEWILVLSAFLGGCTWLAPPASGPFLPGEIIPGWEKEIEEAISSEDLPLGAGGGRVAAWGSGEAWIWAEIVTMGDATTAQALFQDAVASFARYERDSVGDEGVRLVHVPTGLVLHFFRVGPSVALVGALAKGQAVPDPGMVRQAALILARRLPDQEPPLGPSPPPQPPSPVPQAPLEIEVELRAPDGSATGRLTLRAYGTFLGEQRGICRYRLRFHLGKIVLGRVPPDGPFRGPLDLFLGAVLELPCGRITFVTPELVYLRPGQEKVFEEPGPLLAELVCSVPCWRPDLPLNINAILRDNDLDDFLDLVRGFVSVLPEDDPHAAEMGEVVEEITRAHGLQRQEPADPIGTAGDIRGTTLGQGSASGYLPLEEWQEGVKLEFSGVLAIPDSCARPAANVIQCRVREGATGTLTLQAKRTPAGPVHIRADTIPPGWPPFPTTSGFGSVTTQYVFTLPSGTAGRQLILKFRAWTVGVIGDLELQVILDVLPAEGG